MNLTRWDIAVLLSMSIAVILMSFTFPALGLSDSSIEESQIPEFNLSTSSVSFANEQPEYPGNPTEGQLRYVEGAEQYEDNRQVYLSENPDVPLSFFDDDSFNGSTFDGVSFFTVFNSSGGIVNQSELTIQEGETKVHEAGDWAVTISNLNVEYEPEITATLEWDLEQSPQDTSWTSRIPIIGGIFYSGEQLASAIAWIGAMINHYVIVIIEAFANAFLMIYEFMTFLISLFSWLIITYTDIINGTNSSWASVIVAIPGILLSVEFAKITAIGISLLPTT